MSKIKKSAFLTASTILVCLLLALFTGTSSRALEIIMDEFNTDQATLTLTYPAGDLVWYDTDQDGLQDGSEPGVPGIIVDLYGNGTCIGVSIASDTTDAAGVYGFPDLTPATYCLQFSNLPAGWTITLQDQGADDSLDSDADSATARITNINLSATDLNEDVGLYAEGSIGDTVWCDADLDGLYDAGEGVAGVTVDLYQDTNCDTTPDGAAIATQDTTGDGQYLFTGLPVGLSGSLPVCYVVQVDQADMGSCNNPITPVEYDVLLETDDPDDLDNDFGFNQPNSSPIYLPFIVKGFVPSPDLVVTNLAAASNAVTVTIRNIGTAATPDAFWVDVYFNPNPAPPPLNRTWQSIAPYGANWGVTQSLAPGESLTLTIGRPYYAAGSSTFPAGAQVYAYVDSINYATDYGNVQESNEANNVFGPVVSSAGVAGAVAPQGKPVSLEGLPER
jgi:hypothetical protein